MTRRCPCISTTFQSCATVLANLGNPQYDDTLQGSTLPTKHNVQMDFPNLPRCSNQNSWAQQPDNSTVHCHVNIVSTASDQPAVTPDSITQLRAEMKKEFLQMIQDEVQSQIRQEMNAIQAEVANLGTKIDTLQEGIRDNIGAAIRESIKATLTEQAQNNTYTHTHINSSHSTPNPLPTHSQPTPNPLPTHSQPTPNPLPTHTMHLTQNNYSSPASAMNYSTPNYYEPLQPTRQSQDSQMQTEIFDPNILTKQAAAMRSNYEGTSSMEPGAQQS
jgi:hypothetical protein